MRLGRLACSSTESWGVRIGRLTAFILAALASALIATACLLNLLGLRHDARSAASLLFALTSLLLAASCVAGLRQPRRGMIFAFTAATALAFGVTDLGRGTAGLTLTVMRYVAVIHLLVLLLAVVFLCTQLATSLVHKHTCNCG